MAQFQPLTAEQNSILTQTGPGTPCGRFFRQYWQPVAVLEDIAPGMPPKALRIMGEDLVLYRDGRGELGLIGRFCPHRGVDLSYARVDENGLRCLYHGWLIGGDGKCLDQPGQSSETNYAGTVRHTGYPCVEAAGCVFAYMGEGPPPPLPPYDIFTAGDGHVMVNRFLYEGNYIYDLEHNLDPGHSSFIHLQFLESELSEKYGPQTRRYVTGTDWSANRLYAADQVPQIITEEVEYGLRLTAISRAGPGETFLRGMEYRYPNINAVPAHPNGYTLQFHVPVDDNLHWRYDINLDRSNVFDIERARQNREKTHLPDGRLRSNRSNNYMQDRSQMDDWYAGMGPYPPAHDGYLLEATWPLGDRVHEQLGSQDVAIVEARALMLRAIEAMAAGHAISPDTADHSRPVVTFATVVPEGTSWEQLWADREQQLSNI